MKQKKDIDWGEHFQTPIEICNYMASFLPYNAGTILEPTPGKGKLVEALKPYGKVIIPDGNFYEMEKQKFDWIVTNPPFSPMVQGYKILYSCMEMSDNIVALMPYLCMINGEKRTQHIMDFGLKSITHLPRSTFKGSRIQACILHMQKGFKGDTIFKTLPHEK